MIFAARVLDLAHRTELTAIWLDDVGCVCVVKKRRSPVKRSETSRIAASRGPVLPKIPTRIERPGWIQMTTLESNLHPNSEGKKTGAETEQHMSKSPDPFKRVVLIYSPSLADWN